MTPEFQKQFDYAMSEVMRTGQAFQDALGDLNNLVLAGIGIGEVPAPRPHPVPAISYGPEATR